MSFVVYQFKKTVKRKKNITYSRHKQGEKKNLNTNELKFINTDSFRVTYRDKIIEEQQKISYHFKNVR